MKRLIAALSLAAVAIPAIAAGPAYDQAAKEPASAAAALASGPWVNDYHFIAPAQ